MADVDPLSALKSEVFRPLASVVMPGIMAISPFVIVLCNAMDVVYRFYKDKPTWFILAVAGAGTIAGLLLENIGSSIERGVDRCMEVEYLHGSDEVWSEYLSCGVVDNNGRRFLSATVTRLKFINSLMPAMLTFGLGILALQIQVSPWSNSAVLKFFVGLTLLMVWLFRMSTELSEIASNTRFYLLDIPKRPKQYDPEAATVRRWRHFAYVVAELITSKVYAIDLKGRPTYEVVPQCLKVLFGR